MPLRNLTNLWKSLSSRIRKGAIFVLLFWSVLALLAPWIASSEPWYVKVNGSSYFPAFSKTRYYDLPLSGGGFSMQDKSVYDWQSCEAESILFAPIPYAPNSSDLDNADYCSPFAQQVKTIDGKETPMPLRYRHWLGTNKRGEDVLSGILHGARFSLALAIGAMLIAFLIGLVMGILSGYYGNTHWRVNRNALALRTIGFLLIFFVSIWQRLAIWRMALEEERLASAIALSLLLFIAASTLWYFLIRYLERKNYLGSKIVKVPWDGIIQRLIELVQALPLILFLILLSAISKSSFWQLMLLMGAVNWISIARLLRVELQSVRNGDYFIALRGLGVKDRSILFHKALPAIGPLLLLNFAMGIAHCILAEAGLSFLGIGIPADVVTWGTLLSAAKENWNAWWLILFPGLSLASVVMAFNSGFKK
jgi:peptide/nickel transport system permease protein